MICDSHPIIGLQLSEAKRTSDDAETKLRPEAVAKKPKNQTNASLKDFSFIAKQSREDASVASHALAPRLADEMGDGRDVSAVEAANLAALPAKNAAPPAESDAPSTKSGADLAKSDEGIAVDENTAPINS